MVVQLRPRAITVERGSRGFGLSLIYRGLDKYEEKDTGIFVARVVPGGQAARYGVRENDKILTINGKTPRNVDDAVGVIKQAGNQIKLVVLREEDVPGANPDIIIDDAVETSSLASDLDLPTPVGCRCSNRQYIGSPRTPGDQNHGSPMMQQSMRSQTPGMNPVPNSQGMGQPRMGGPQGNVSV